MPTTYAHYRFGKDVLSVLPMEQKKVIEDNIDIFNYALHGPDLLFYYRPIFFNNKIVSAGRRIHHESGETFFSNAAKTLKKHKFKKADVAFIYGYICHFALDIACHGYVNERVTIKNIPHSTTEAEFDRYLLIKDMVTEEPAGYSPITHLHPSRENSKIMHEYYKPYVNMSTHKLTETQNTAIMMIRGLTNKSAVKRCIRKSVMKLAGPYIGGLIMTTKPDKRCADSNIELERRYNEAIPLAVKLINDFISSANSNIWDKEYASTFDPLSISEELTII